VESIIESFCGVVPGEPESETDDAV